MENPENLSTTQTEELEYPLLAAISISLYRHLFHSYHDGCF